MAIEPTTTTTITAPLTREQARELTDEVKSDVSTLWMKVLTLYEGAAHVALDYESWREYWEVEFGSSGTRGEQMLRSGRVARALERHQLPLPTSDAIARALTPVLRYAPDELPKVWNQALKESGGNPTGVQVRKLTDPFRKGKQGARREETTADGRSIRRLRGAVGAKLHYAHRDLILIQEAVPNALRTSPPQTMVQDWITEAEKCKGDLDKIIEGLKRR